MKAMYGLRMVLGERYRCDARAEGDRMPTMVVTHNVVDVDRWLKGESERADAMGLMGAVNVVGHVAQDGGTPWAFQATSTMFMRC